jgi:large subunit ribosomal protein L24
MASKIKKGDQVIVIAGAAKGTVGTVAKVIPEFSQVIVDGVNRVKRHMKPSPRAPEGGIVEKDRPIHVSNVALVDPTTNKATRVRFEVGADGKKSRVAVKSGTVIAAGKPGSQSAQSGSDSTTAG